MQESYGERLATYIGPESCGTARKGSVEALTGESTGQPLSRERIQTSGRRRCRSMRKATPEAPIERGAFGVPRGLRPWARMETPHTEAGRSLVRPKQKTARGRIGKSKDVRR